MTIQPKPLRLADLIDPKKLGLEFVNAKNLSAAAEQLRRLHESNQELLVALDLMRLCADAAIAKSKGKAEAPTVIGCTNCDNKTSYRLTPTCTECGHDMVTDKAEGTPK